MYGLGTGPEYIAPNLGREVVKQLGVVKPLGAGPLALSDAHRAQTAHTLLMSTDLSIADVAFASGFSSSRQFTETMRAVYGTTPTALRAQTAGSTSTRQPEGSATQITLRLPARPPFDGVGLFAFFVAHAVKGIETADASSFARAVRLPGGVAEIELRLDEPNAITCTARLENIADLSPLVLRVRRLLDLDADSAAIDASLSADVTLAPLVAARPGIRLPGSLDIEETLFRTMIGQQVSVAAATTVIGRLASGLSATPGLFPTAVEIAESAPGVVRGPATRVASILAVARAIANGSLTLDVRLPADEFSARLTALPGIGPWTAGYLAIRVLGNPDVLLASDLVMLASASRLGLPSTARSLAAHGARWAPWRSYAGLHLWSAAGR